MLAHTGFYAHNQVSMLVPDLNIFFEKNKNGQNRCQNVHKNISNLVVETVCELDV
jgi:hypothetical protein